MLFPTGQFLTEDRTAWRLLPQRLLCVLVFLAVCIGHVSAAKAAGCAHRTENASIGLDPFGKPLASNVLKVYSGGEFHYFVLPQGKPCNGPNCKGAPPVNIASVPQVITSERGDLTFLTSSAYVRSPHCRKEYAVGSFLRPTSPVLDGLLRPPTV